MAEHVEIGVEHAHIFHALDRRGKTREPLRPYRFESLGRDMPLRRLPREQIDGKLHYLPDARRSQRTEEHDKRRRRAALAIPLLFYLLQPFPEGNEDKDHDGIAAQPVHEAVVPTHLVEDVEGAAHDRAAGEHNYVSQVLRKGKTVPEKPFQKVRRPHKDRRTDAGKDPVLGIPLQAVDDGEHRRQRGDDRLAEDDSHALCPSPPAQLVGLYPFSLFHIRLFCFFSSYPRKVTPRL